MRLVALLLPFGTFGLALAAHVVLWRVRRPRADMKAILALFMVVPGLVFAGALAALWLRPQLYALTTCEELVAVALLHLALSAAYVQTYPAAQAGSPSLLILHAVGGTDGGLTRDEIAAALPKGDLVGTRLADLQSNALVRRDGDRFVLGGLGAALAAFFAGYRRLLGLRGRGG